MIFKIFDAQEDYILDFFFLENCCGFLGFLQIMNANLGRALNLENKFFFWIRGMTHLVGFASVFFFLTYVDFFFFDFIC